MKPAIAFLLHRVIGLGIRRGPQNDDRLAQGVRSLTDRVLAPANKPKIERAASRVLDHSAMQPAAQSRDEQLCRLEQLTRQAVAFSLGLRRGDSLIIRDAAGAERALSFDDVDLPGRDVESTQLRAFRDRLARDLGVG